MNILSRDKQIQIIAALTEGMSIRATERLTGVHRDTIMRLGARVGTGCAAFHDRTMHSLRIGRLELDELWAYVGCKQKNVKRKDLAVTRRPIYIRRPGLDGPRDRLLSHRQARQR